ncbi:carbohydrate ABC transporter permease [Arthrobacter sp. MMS18-M83]|uniref:carbohydrate ABC transporter permease n=1 Tax=Arthrobacter sp. MMS18-M83 TaxID=2996261 RepID=UPI00227BD6B6|nr:carbohydrate ABC transporter permease [Arthrobacter sp. MMS18-M83]WAH99164.1 carbohydrate ABC transporter permease [Arthrobacter sp. MMS18-M83]
MRSTLLARIGVLAVFVAYAVPLLLITLASFKSSEEIVNDPASLIFRPTLEAYANVLTPQFLLALGNSVVIAGGAALLTIAVATPLSYVLARARGGWTAVVVGILIALQMTPAATAVIPQFRILASLGLLGTTLGVILAMSASALPYAILILRPFFLAVPGEVEEAAQVDGAGPFRSFTTVVFPLARNGVSLVTVLLFIGAWGEFLYPISFLNDQDLFPLSVLIVQQQGFYGTQWNNLMALALVGALPTIIIFALVARKLTSGLALGVGK